MPRDSSGNYTLPLGNPVIDGTVIDVNWANPTMNDIAVQLNNVVTRDGLLGFINPAFFVDGTPALPGIAFAAQHSTGMWRDATQLGLSYNGVSIQQWDGTGTNITGNLGVSGNIGFSGPGPHTSPWVLKTGDTMAGPGTLLTLNPVGSNYGLVLNSDGAGASYAIQLFHGGLCDGFAGVGNSGVANIALRDAMGIGTQTAHPITFLTTNIERMRIDAAGNAFVGIVPAAYPTQKLTVKIAVEGGGINGVNGLIVARAANDSMLYFGFNTIPDAWVIGASYQLTGGYKPIAFATSDIERARIDAAGIFTYQGIEVGWKNVVPYTQGHPDLNPGMRGRMVLATSQLNFVPNAYGFAAGDVVSILNTNTVAIGIGQYDGSLIYHNGVAKSCTLAPQCMATMWFASDAVAYITGSGLT